MTFTDTSQNQHHAEARGEQVDGAYEIKDGRVMELWDALQELTRVPAVIEGMAQMEQLERSVPVDAMPPSVEGMHAMTGINRADTRAAEAAVDAEMNPGNWNAFLDDMQQTILEEHPELNESTPPVVATMPAANSPTMAEQARQAAAAAHEAANNNEVMSI